MPASAALLLALLASCARAQSADLILKGGTIFLGPGRSCRALAVTGNRVTAIGTDAEISAVKGAGTRVVELKGRAVVPGFHDAHARVMAGAMSLYELDLTGAAAADEVRRRVADYGAALPPGAWAVGRGFDEALLPSTGAARAPLDVLASTRPAALTSAGGTALWLNAEALRRLRLDSPTGVLRGAEKDAALKRVPPPDRAQKLSALRLALALMRQKGVTAVDELPDAGEPAADELLSLWRELAVRGEAAARLVLYGRLEDPLGYAKLRASASDLPRTRVLLPGVAGTIDGPLGAHEAALSIPYFDAPETRGGALKLSGFELTTKLRAAMDQGLQVALRASGDRAVKVALDACAKAAPAAQERGAALPRFACRIEGPEVVSDADLARLKRMPVAFVPRPANLVFDDLESNYYANRLGDAVKSALPLRSLEKARAFLAFGSGWPERPLDPQAGLYGAVTRKSRDGKPAQGFVPSERLGVESALDHAANDAWELDGLGDELGDIRPGRIADLVVFDRNALSSPSEFPLDARVDLTVFDGRVVFERER